nr:hypothetical protein GCM10020093_083060 [Planobispora longispora]
MSSPTSSLEAIEAGITFSMGVVIEPSGNSTPRYPPMTTQIQKATRNPTAVPTGSLRDEQL